MAPEQGFCGFLWRIYGRLLCSACGDGAVTASGELRAEKTSVRLGQVQFLIFLWV